MIWGLVGVGAGEWGRCEVEGWGTGEVEGVGL